MMLAQQTLTGIISSSYENNYFTHLDFTLKECYIIENIYLYCSYFVKVYKETRNPL